MSLTVATVIAAAGATLPQCSWDRPGANAFTGDVVAAVDRYKDIPAATRAKLKARMEQRQYDEIAVIGRNSITGKATYSPEIRDMHFGAGTVCRTVTRSRWDAKAEERGLVYCEDEHCLIVPTVCRNVSRVTRLKKAPTTAAVSPGVTGAAATPLASEPTGAGVAQTPAAPADEGEQAMRLAMAPQLPDAGVPLQAGELQFEAPAAGQSFVAQAEPTTSISPLLPFVGSGSGGSAPGIPWLGGGGVAAGGGGGGGTAPTTPTEQPGGTREPPPPSFSDGVVGTAPGVGGTTPGTGGTTPAAPGLPFEVPSVLPGNPQDGVPPIPEPGTWLMMLLGVAAVVVAKRGSLRQRSN
jgi:hypothetical protein